jgi:hypothetical protein
LACYQKKEKRENENENDSFEHAPQNDIIITE